MDLFAQALRQYYETGAATLVLERDDGFRDTEDLSWYLTNYAEFPRFEKQALKFVRGRVLDLGCGAGRHALYLQRRHLNVMGVDVSECAVELARARGVRNVRRVDTCKPLPFKAGEFDTVLLFGNNLGLCGTPAKFRHMLRELHRITSLQARLVATTRMPGVSDPLQLAYLKRNLERGRPLGQVRLRLVFNGRRGAWFNLLLFAPTELMRRAAQEQWVLSHLLVPDGLEEGYGIVLEKG